MDTASASVWVLEGLRKMTQSSTPLLQRPWRPIDARGGLRVLSFNVLGESKQSEEKWLASAADALKDWALRRLRLLEVVLQEDPDLIFLQELDVTGKESVLCPELKEAGYDAVFPPVPPTASAVAVPAVFLRRRRFGLLRACASLDFAAVAVVQDLEGAATLAVASGHLFSGKDAIAEARRSEECSKLLDLLAELAADHVIFAGDLNAMPVADSKIGAPLAYAAALRHPLQLRSAYATGSEEPTYTTWKIRPKGEIKRTIDYIFHSSSGELFGAIRSLGILNGSQARFYTGSLILALQALHEKMIIYRDLKPENVLLDNYGYIKLIDFGCAARLNKGGHRSLVGTPHYMAPEVILGKEYNCSCDVWSLGVCLYEFVCGPLPFGQDLEDPKQVFQEILLAKVSFPEHFTNLTGKHLLRSLLRKNSQLRIGGVNGLQDVREHEYFRKFSFARLLGRNLEPPLVSSPPGTPRKDEGAIPQDPSESEPLEAREISESEDWAAEF